MKASKQPCFLCGKERRPASCCEDWCRVTEALEVQGPRRKRRERPCRVTMCKDCCIRDLEGHQCVWWDFCWH